MSQLHYLEETLVNRKKIIEAQYAKNIENILDANIDPLDKLALLDSHSGWEPLQWIQHPFQEYAERWASTLPRTKNLPKDIRVQINSDVIFSPDYIDRHQVVNLYDHISELEDEEPLGVLVAYLSFFGYGPNFDKKDYPSVELRIPLTQVHQILLDWCIKNKSTSFVYDW